MNQQQKTELIAKVNKVGNDYQRSSTGDNIWESKPATMIDVKYLLQQMIIEWPE